MFKCFSHSSLKQIQNTRIHIYQNIYKILVNKFSTTYCRKKISGMFNAIDKLHLHRHLSIQITVAVFHETNFQSTSKNIQDKNLPNILLPVTFFSKFKYWYLVLQINIFHNFILQFKKRNFKQFKYHIKLYSKIKKNREIINNCNNHVQKNEQFHVCNIKPYTYFSFKNLKI